MSSSSKKTVVAAIDFGTTYSGYAYSTRENYKRDPLAIAANRQWPAELDDITSYKTPTSILFDKNMECTAFGFAAEAKFAEQCSEGNEQDSSFFRHFKLLLHNTSSLGRSTQLTSVQGTVTNAMFVFSESIKFMKDHLMKAVTDNLSNITQQDIQFVLTVPAIWNETAKQFMREAAEKAGIDPHRLLIALEPEAASIYCRLLPTLGKKSGDGSTALEALPPDTKYIILDIGGGTADISVHHIEDDGSIVEVTTSSGGTWGGLQVDKEFIALLAELYGQEIVDEFRANSQEQNFELTKRCEFQKCHIKANDDDWNKIVMPSQLRELFTERTKLKCPENHQYGAKVKFVADKLCCQSSVLRKIFDPTIQSIVNHMKTMMEKDEVREAKYVFVVGGLSQSAILIKALREAFPDVTFLMPSDALLAVLNGAVLYGHDQVMGVVAHRSAFTYGIERLERFDPCRHPENKKMISNGEESCKDVIHVLVEEDELIPYDHTITEFYYPEAREESHAVIMLYKCQKRLEPGKKMDKEVDKKVKFITDDDVELVGYLIIEVPASEGNARPPILITTKFGRSEIEVSTLEPKSGKKFSAQFDFLRKYDEH